MNRIRQFLKVAFADRQIYIRSRGNVTFIPLSSHSQMILGVFFILLSGWVALASVNTIFRAQLAEQRERDLREMQISYETELSRLRLAHDDLNAQLVLTRDWFGETTNKLEKRHNELTDILERHADISGALRDMQKSFATIATRRRSSSRKTNLVGRSGNSIYASLENRSERTGAMNQLVQLTKMKSDGDNATPAVGMPHLSGHLFQRVSTLGSRQSATLDDLEKTVDLKVSEFENLIADTKIIETESFMARVLPESERAIGGPYIPLKGVTNHQNALNRQIYRISSNLDRLSELSKSLANIPLALPIHNFQITSGFGPRLDPFKKRAAFHSGIDFGAVTGTPIHAPLAGIVTHANYKGPYGLVVEINHGNGFRTRFAHLARVHVNKGQQIEFQQHIGDAGNSGRSTGPHLHYEIWYDGQVRNPAPFIASGRQVFNAAKTIGNRKSK